MHNFHLIFSLLIAFHRERSHLLTCHIKNKSHTNTSRIYTHHPKHPRTSSRTWIPHACSWCGASPPGAAAWWPFNNPSQDASARGSACISISAISRTQLHATCVISAICANANILSLVYINPLQHLRRMFRYVVYIYMLYSIRIRPAWLISSNASACACE